jgi:iron complex outermembrane receptor protein
MSRVPLSLLAAFAILTAKSYSQATPTIDQVTAPADSSPKKENTTVLEKLVVTGSNIPLAADALAVPVAVIDLAVMEESGVNSDTLDILRKVSPSIGGIGEENAQTNVSATFGGASAYINGLSTLVLVDGRRVVNDPAGGVGGDEFVDLNLIPPAAIERIEVLENGASAIYGSDAVGGVINIILKKDYNGWETGVHYGYSANTSHYAERSAYLAGGFSNDKTSITIAVDYSQRDAIFMKDRSYTDPIYNTYTHPGVIDIYDVASGSDTFYELARGVNAPPGGGNSTIDQLVAQGVYVPKPAGQVLDEFNLANDQTLTSALQRYSMMANMEHRFFGDSLVGFSNVIVAHTYTWSELNPQPNVPYLEDAYIDNNFYWGFTPPPSGTVYVPTSAPTNPFSPAFVDQAGDGQSGEIITVRNRLLSSPRLSQNDSDLFRVVGGLRGDLNENLHWEAAANVDRYTLDFTNPGLIATSAFDAALADGRINPFAIAQAQGALDGVVGTAFIKLLSTLNSFDFKVDGTPLDLPAGRLGFAFGASYVHEVLSAAPDASSLPNAIGTAAGWSDVGAYNDFSNGRTITSEFAELSVPVTGAKQDIVGAHAINLDAAARYDDYSGNVGAAIDPEFNVSWAPFDDQFKFRGSTGSSFIAPSLYNLYGPVSTGEQSPVTYNVYNGNGAQNTSSFNGTSGSNPDLKPTRARSWTAGFVFTPDLVMGLSITVDFLHIAQRDNEGEVPAPTIVQSVELLGTASPYANLVHYNGPDGPTVTGPGGISSHAPQDIYITGTLINVGGEKLGTTDIKVDYSRKFAGIGKLDLASSWSNFNTTAFQFVTSEPYYNYAGQVSGLGTDAKWASYSTLAWSNGGAEAFLAYSFIGSATDIGAGGNPTGFEKVGAFTQYDLGFSYDFKGLHRQKWLKGLKLTAGVNNVFNKMPPEAPDVFTNTNADVATYDGAIGRMFYVNGRYRY